MVVAPPARLTGESFPKQLTFSDRIATPIGSVHGSEHDIAPHFYNPMQCRGKPIRRHHLHPDAKQGSFALNLKTAMVQPRENSVREGVPGSNREIPHSSGCLAGLSEQFRNAMIEAGKVAGTERGLAGRSQPEAVHTVSGNGFWRGSQSPSIRSRLMKVSVIFD